MRVCCTHSLRRLFRAVNLDGLEAYKAQLYELSDAYFNTRYPGEDYWEITQAEASSLCTVAAAVVGMVEAEIEKFRV